MTIHGYPLTISLKHRASATTVLPPPSTPLATWLSYTYSNASAKLINLCYNVANLVAGVDQPGKPPFGGQRPLCPPLLHCLLLYIFLRPFKK